MFTVRYRYYYAGRLGVMVNGKPYEYAVSPFWARKFEVMSQFNKGRALALLRGKEVEEMCNHICEDCKYNATCYSTIAKAWREAGNRCPADKIAELEEEVSRVRSGERKLTAQRDSLSEMNQCLEIDRQDLWCRIEAGNREVKQSNDLIASQRRRIDRLDNEGSSDLKRKVNKLTESLQFMETSRNTFRARNDEQYKTIREYQNGQWKDEDFSDAGIRMRETEEECKDLKKRNEIQKSMLRAFADIARREREEHRELKDEIARIRSGERNLTAQRDELQRCNKNQGEQIRSLWEDAEALEAQRDELNDENLGLDRQVAYLNKQTLAPKPEDDKVVFAQIVQKGYGHVAGVVDYLSTKLVVKLAQVVHGRLYKRAK